MRSSDFDIIGGKENEARKYPKSIVGNILKVLAIVGTLLSFLVAFVLFYNAQGEYVILAIATIFGGIVSALLIYCIGAIYCKIDENNYLLLQLIFKSKN